MAKSCRLTAILLAILVIAGSHGFAQSAVLCLGADGHIAVESLDHGCCRSEHQQQKAPAANCSDRSPHCGDCTDLDLGASANTSSITALPNPQSASGVISTEHMLATRAFDWTLSPQRSLADRALLEIEAVILRT